MLSFLDQSEDTASNHCFLYTRGIFHLAGVLPLWGLVTLSMYA